MRASTRMLCMHHQYIGCNLVYSVYLWWPTGSCDSLYFLCGMYANHTYNYYYCIIAPPFPNGAQKSGFEMCALHRHRRSTVDAG